LEGTTTLANYKLSFPVYYSNPVAHTKRGFFSDLSTRTFRYTEKVVQVGIGK